MKSVGAYEAKTHLRRPLDEVEAGESIAITRHGRPVAILNPARERKRRPVEAVIQEIMELSRGNRLDGLTIREMIDESRRY
ncbi:MAG: type II toxin-antitoxin system prevent-host-death family antitoxin [Dehalococcoidia bacterium]|nr:type II toxin-antitoxin system prevent-host-death family antitoxin [Dehalococcoidia bacterium]